MPAAPAIDPAEETAFALAVLLTDPRAGPGLAAMKAGDPEGYADAVREYADATDGDGEDGDGDAPPKKG